MPFSIPVRNISELNSSIEAFNKKAVKSGFKPAKLILLEENKTEEKTQLIKSEFGEEVLTYDVLCNIYEIECEPLHIDGWEPLCLIDHDLKLVKEFKDKVVDFKTCAELPNKCDHCNKKRKRIETVLITNGKEVKQIGLSCIKEYLGIDPKDLLYKLSELKTIRDMMEEYGHNKGPIISTLSYLYVITFLSDSKGYISKEKANEQQCLSTKQEAIEICCDNIDLVKVLRQVTDDQKQFVKAALIWAQSIEPKTAFEQNMKACSFHDAVLDKTSGFIAAIVPCYKNTLKQKAIRESQKESEHLAVGKKIDLEVTLLHVFSNHAVFNGRSVEVLSLFFLGSDGNLYTWKTSSHVPIDGPKYRLVGRVKANTEYKGRKQNQLTHCKMTSLNE